MMPKEQVEKRMAEIELYLNQLTTNQVALSTKYFPEFLGFSMKVFFFYITP